MPGGAEPTEDAPRPPVEQQVEAQVEQQVEQRVGDEVREQVDAQLGDVTTEAATAAEQAGVGAERAEQARDGAEQARDDATEAGTAAVGRSGRRRPRRPLLDDAVRQLEARATPDQPVRAPRSPARGRSPFRTAFTASLGVAVAYGLVQAVIGVRSVLVLLLVAAFLAIGLDPVVQALERRHCGAVSPSPSCF